MQVGDELTLLVRPDQIERVAQHDRHTACKATCDGLDGRWRRSPLGSRVAAALLLLSLLRRIHVDQDTIVRTERDEGQKSYFWIKSLSSTRFVVGLVECTNRTARGLEI